LQVLKPRRIKVCVLLDKPVRRAENVEADYIGFEVPDCFVVGYGLDFAERYRNLPFLGVLRPHLCGAAPDLARDAERRRRHARRQPSR